MSGVRCDRRDADRLKLAWMFRTGKPGSEAIPIVVDGVMYVTAPDGVYALVPETGALLWKYDASPLALRGLAYWPGTGGLHSRLMDRVRQKEGLSYSNQSSLQIGALDPDGRFVIHAIAAHSESISEPDLSWRANILEIAEEELLRLQRETGANIVTVMENLSAVIRERLQLRADYGNRSKQ